MKGKKFISTLKAQEKNVSRVSSIIPKSPSLKWLDQSRNFLRVGWLTPFSLRASSPVWASETGLGEPARRLYTFNP